MYDYDQGWSLVNEFQVVLIYIWHSLPHGKRLRKYTNALQNWPIVVLSLDSFMLLCWLMPLAVGAAAPASFPPAWAVCLMHTPVTYVGVHVRVSVNNKVWYCRLEPSNVYSIIFLKPEGMPRRLTAYARERVVRLWQQGKMPGANREETCESRHLHHKAYCYASDLLLDEGCWIGRPEQIGAAFCGN